MNSRQAHPNQTRFGCALFFVESGGRRAISPTLPRWRLLFGLVLLVGNTFAKGAESPIQRELIQDPHFRRGATVLQPEPGKRVPYGIVAGPQTNARPVWDLDQWSSHYPLPIASPTVLLDGSLVYSNLAKAITFGVSGSSRGDVSLAVRASTEYGSRARTPGEPWVHLLLEQTLQDQPALSEIDAARLHVEAQLVASKKGSMSNYSPGLHAAQFQIFFSVQNLNPKSPGYGKYLWFGVPIYDDRHRVVPAFHAQDTGGTSMYIYTPASDTFSAKSAHDGEWIAIDRDLLPLMIQGLRQAWQRGFLKESESLADYRIAGMNVGWELPGTFDVELQIRGLSLKVSPLSKKTGL